MNTTQKIPAGLTDDNIEIFAHNDKVSFTRNGRVFSIRELERHIIRHFMHEMFQNSEARTILRSWCHSAKKMLEQYVFCNYGGFDVTPDFDTKENKSHPEPWNCGMQDTCEGFGKVCRPIGDNGEKITHKEMQVLRAIASGHPDKWLNDKLGITMNTLASHKKNISRKLKLHSKMEMILFAMKNYLI